MRFAAPHDAACDAQRHRPDDVNKDVPAARQAGGASHDRGTRVISWFSAVSGTALASCPSSRYKGHSPGWATESAAPDSVQRDRVAGIALLSSRRRVQGLTMDAFANGGVWARGRWFHPICMMRRRSVQGDLASECRGRAVARRRLSGRQKRVRSRSVMTEGTNHGDRAGAAHRAGVQSPRFPR